MAVTTEQIDDQIQWGQTIREDVVHTLMREGVPTDKDSLDLILKATKDHSTVAIQNRRNQIEAEGGKSAHELLGAMAEFVKMAKNKNPFARAPEEDVPAGVRPVVSVDELGVHEHASGEEHLGLVNETSEEFQARMERWRAENPDPDE
jgi:hypothetical protein